MKFLISILLLTLFNFVSCEIDKIKEGECLERGDAKYSKNGCFKLFVTDEGDLQINLYSWQHWSSKATIKGATKVCMESDGNLKLKLSNGEVTWTSGENYESDGRTSYNIKDEETSAEIGGAGELIVRHNKTVNFSSKNFSVCKIFTGPDGDPVRAHQAGIEIIKKGKY